MGMGVECELQRKSSRESRNEVLTQTGCAWTMVRWEAIDVYMLDAEVKAEGRCAGSRGDDGGESRL